MYRKKIVKYVLGKTYRPFLEWYLSSVRMYRYYSLTLRIPPGVFHPAFFYSTRLLIQFLETQSVKGKKILELGSGSGLIAMLVSKRGAIVTASDINQTAVENGMENSRRNKLSVSFVRSNLFQSLSGQTYDMIIINPPYYPKDPVGESQYAWYCGKDFDYFHSLFDQLFLHLTTEGQAFMVLSDDCDIARIETIAHEASFQLKKVYEQRLWSEDNYIFELVHSSKIKTAYA